MIKLNERTQKKYEVERWKCIQAWNEFDTAINLRKKRKIQAKVFQRQTTGAAAHHAVPTTNAIHNAMLTTQCAQRDPFYGKGKYENTTN